MINFTGAEVVDLDLPLSQPATGLLFELAESADFFYGYQAMSGTGWRCCPVATNECSVRSQIHTDLSLFLGFFSRTYCILHEYHYEIIITRITSG